MTDVDSIYQQLKSFPDPETGRCVVQMEQVSNVRVEDGKLRLSFGLTTHSAPIWPEIRSRFEAHVKAKLPQFTEVEIEHVVHEREPDRQGEAGLTAKSVILVGAGKGGVGKSTVSAALALALKQLGSAVGLMDADVYGPSIPHLLGVTEQPTTADNRIIPVRWQDMPVMSLGLMVPQHEAMIWRGPMLNNTVRTFVGGTVWGPLDYLIIDLPPGTGDVALSLSQMLAPTGAVVVCTPQDVALLDAVRAVTMFRKVKIPLLGIVENMSGFSCPGCDQRYDIFGSGGAKQKGDELGIPVLGEVPITIPLREQSDAGNLAQTIQPDGPGAVFLDIATNLVRNLANSAEEEPPQVELPVLG